MQYKSSFTLTSCYCIWSLTVFPLASETMMWMSFSGIISEVEIVTRNLIARRVFIGISTDRVNILLYFRPKLIMQLSKRIRGQLGCCLGVCYPRCMLCVMGVLQQCVLSQWCFPCLDWTPSACQRWKTVISSYRLEDSKLRKRLPSYFIVLICCPSGNMLDISVRSGWHE